MPERFSRTEALIGPEGLARLSRARVAVFGLGGVGSWAAEALARSGVGALDLIDGDAVTAGNINRQLFALDSTVGQYKTEAARRRLAEINPRAVLRTYNLFYLPETAGAFDFRQYDYIVDAIDTVAGKLQLAVRAGEAGTPVISSMGTGNKLDPAALEVADIYDTAVCPLARVMRRELRKRGIEALKVVYSKEPPIAPRPGGETRDTGRPVPGSLVFVPAAAGLLLASEVVKDIIKTPEA